MARMTREEEREYYRLIELDMISEDNDGCQAPESHRFSDQGRVRRITMQNWQWQALIDPARSSGQKSVEVTPDGKHVVRMPHTTYREV